LVFLIAAMIPQLWFPDGPLAPTWRLVSLFGAVALLAGALGAFNRWVVASRNARTASRRAALRRVDTTPTERDFENPSTTYPLQDTSPERRPGREPQSDERRP